MSWRDLETFSLGDSPALADELAALVLAGRKRVTCWAVVDGMPTELGKRMVMLNGAGHPRGIIETIELRLLKFVEVDAAFAYDEGEGDLTLAYWQKAHCNYSLAKVGSPRTCNYGASASGSRWSRAAAAA